MSADSSIQLQGIGNTAYQVTYSRQPADTTWDAFTATVPGGHHVQTSLWAQVKASLKWESIRIKVMCRGQIVGGCQLLIRRYPPLGAVGYVSKGPLVESHEPDLIRTIMDKLHEVSYTECIRYLIVQPPDDGEPVRQVLAEYGYRPSPIKMAPTATLRINLTKGLDDLLAAMKRQNRQNIRRCEREGVTVREGSRDDLQTFYSLHTATSARQSFCPYQFEYYVTMWDTLRPERYIALLLAEIEGEPISAMLLIPFRDTVIARELGWSGEHKRRRPNEGLLWASIKWAKVNGYRWFDFEGIDPGVAKAILAGEPIPERARYSPTQFKLMFGGEVSLCPPPYDYVMNPVARWVYHRLPTDKVRVEHIQGIVDQLRKR